MDRNIPQKEKKFSGVKQNRDECCEQEYQNGLLTWRSLGVGGSKANLCCLVVCLSSETAVYWSDETQMTCE